MVVKHFSMPNHLIDPPIVPELIQENATVENMILEVSRLIDDVDYYQHMHEVLSDIAPALDEDSGMLACDAIEQVLSEHKSL